MAIGDETATLDRPVALHGMTLGCGFAFVDGTNRIDLGRSGIRALDATSAKAYSIGVLAPEGLLGRAAGEDAPAVREAPRGAGRPDGVGEIPDVSRRWLGCLNQTAKKCILHHVFVGGVMPLAGKRGEGCHTQCLKKRLKSLTKRSRTRSFCLCAFSCRSNPPHA